MEPPKTYIVPMTKRTRGERKAYFEGMKASLNFIQEGKTLEQSRESIKICCDAINWTDSLKGDAVPYDPPMQPPCSFHDWAISEDDGQLRCTACNEPVPIDEGIKDMMGEIKRLHNINRKERATFREITKAVQAWYDFHSTKLSWKNEIEKKMIKALGKLQEVGKAL